MAGNVLRHAGILLSLFIIESKSAGSNGIWFYDNIDHDESLE